VGWGVVTPLPALVVVLVVVLDFEVMDGLVVLDSEVVEGTVALVEVVIVISVLGAVLELGVVVGGSLLTVPIMQYSSSASTSGQLMPGFNFVRSSTDMPQLAAKLSHVAPLSAFVEKSQSTPRRE
jgi:hypothetical protein